MSNLVTFKYKCPICKYKNTYNWPQCDIPQIGDHIVMVCDKCNKKSLMMAKLVPDT